MTLCTACGCWLHYCWERSCATDAVPLVSCKLVQYCRTPAFADPAYSLFIKCDLLLHLWPCASRIHRFYFYFLFFAFLWVYSRFLLLLLLFFSPLFVGIFYFPLWITNHQEPIPLFPIETIPQHSLIWHSRHFSEMYPPRMLRSDSTHFAYSVASPTVLITATESPLSPHSVGQFLWRNFFRHMTAIP